MLKAPLTRAGPVRGFLRSSVWSLQKPRKRPEMATISLIALLLPAKQGKHFPRSSLQGTESPGQASMGAGAYAGGFLYLPSGTILPAPGPPGKLPKMF